MLTVNEIFHSIQGESTYAGEPCVFVRLTACDLRCRWCDTPYAFHEGRKMSVDEVVAEVERYGCPMVEVTGGEPLLQPDVYPLMQRLLDAGQDRAARDRRPPQHRARCPPGVIRIVDVKCPGSGESEKNDWANLRAAHRDRSGEVRHRRSRRLRVRARRRRARAAGRHAWRRCCSRRCTACSTPKQLAEWMLADALPVRLQLQAHKFIWGRATSDGRVARAACHDGRCALSSC